MFHQMDICLLICQLEAAKGGKRKLIKVTIVMKKSLLALFFLCTNVISSNYAFAYNLKTSGDFKYEYPSFATFVNDKEHSRITAHCNDVKEKNGKIICTFNQVMVRHVDTKSETDDIDKLKSMSDKDIQNRFKKFCESLDEDHGFNKKIEDLYKTAKLDEERKSILYFKNVCTNPSRINVTKWMEDTLQKKQSTCTIYDKTYEQSFQYSPTIKQWYSNQGPDLFNLTNDCGIIYIDSLKKDSREGRDYSWDYTTRKVITNKSGSVLGSAICSKLNEEEMIYYGAYSNLVDTTLLMNCKYINFADSF